MGSAFDFFGGISHSEYTEGLTDVPITNRLILRRAMINNGFNPHPEKWRHLSLEDEPYPDTYFDFPVDMPER